MRNERDSGKADAVGGPSSRVVREGEEKEPGSTAVGSDRGPEGFRGRRAGAHTVPADGWRWRETRRSLGRRDPRASTDGSRTWQKTETDRRRGGDPGQSLSLVLRD